jgi:heterodisulfide reductase subunit B
MQQTNESERGTNHHVPAILYPQLLGLCMGIDKAILGLHNAEIDIAGVENFLAKERGRKST